MRQWAMHTMSTSTFPRVALGAGAVLMALLSHTARADTHCYDFRNNSAGVAMLSFSYHPSVGNVITGAAVDPGKTYPFDGREYGFALLLADRVAQHASDQADVVPQCAFPIGKFDNIHAMPRQLLLPGTKPRRDDMQEAYLNPPFDDAKSLGSHGSAADSYNA